MKRKIVSAGLLLVVVMCALWWALHLYHPRRREVVNALKISEDETMRANENEIQSDLPMKYMVMLDNCPEMKSSFKGYGSGAYLREAFLLFGSILAEEDEIQIFPGTTASETKSSYGISGGMDLQEIKAVVDQIPYITENLSSSLVDEWERKVMDAAEAAKGKANVRILTICCHNHKKQLSQNDFSAFPMEVISDALEFSEEYAADDCIIEAEDFPQAVFRTTPYLMLQESNLMTDHFTLSFPTPTDRFSIVLQSTFPEVIFAGRRYTYEGLILPSGRILYQVHMDSPTESMEIFLNKKENQQIQIIYPMDATASDKPLILREE